MTNKVTHIKTLKVRVKDRHAAELSRMARSVNWVWNYINDLSFRSIKEHERFLSAFDFHPYTKGANKDLGLHSQTVQQIAAEYVTRRKQFKKRKLSWRASSGSRRALGWIPINTGTAKWKKGCVYHNGTYFKVWDPHGLEEYKFRSGSFNEDARGRWYFNVVVEVEVDQSIGQKAVGIDLGCKEAITTSDGDKVTGRWYREQEEKLAKAQRANQKKQARNINAKIANKRKDELHKFSRKLVNENGLVVVGDVSSKKLTQTKMAKSVNDAGWAMFKTMLKYKSDHAGVVYEEVNEAYTTQTCSCCGSRPDSRPKGIAGLGIREWTCSDCRTTHDRDINAAKNILALGHGRLVGGIPVLKDGVDVKQTRIMAILSCSEVLQND